MSIRSAVRAALAAAILLGALPVTAQLTSLQQDIHFRAEDGSITRGVRCPVDLINPREADPAPPADPLALTIPVAWHVLERADGFGDLAPDAIAASINVLNAAFAPTGVQFQLVSTDVTKNDTWFHGCAPRTPVEYAIKQSLAIDPATTLNIYSCRPPKGTLGWAYYPFTFPESDPRHGVVVRYSSVPGGSASAYDQGDTLTHEVGHWMGLLHTFQGGCNEPGDGVSDTASEHAPAYACPMNRNSCSDAALDPIQNFMDYTDDSCMNSFTSGQDARMDAQIKAYKPSLGN